MNGDDKGQWPKPDEGAGAGDAGGPAMSPPPAGDVPEGGDMGGMPGEEKKPGGDAPAE